MKILVCSLLPILVIAVAQGQKREFSNRFEGSYHEQANPDLDILGVLRSRIEFKSPASLSVRFFLPSSVSRSTVVSIEAQELLQSRNYFMQSKPFKVKAGEWNSFGPWPTSDVLDTLGVKANNLTLTASYMDATGTRIYLPANLISLVAHTESIYTIQFRTAWSLHSLEETLTGPDRLKVSLATMTCLAGPSCIRFDAGSSSLITLDLGHRPEGLYTLHLIGHVAQKIEPIQATIVFSHKKDR